MNNIIKELAVDNHISEDKIMEYVVMINDTITYEITDDVFIKCLKDLVKSLKSKKEDVKTIIYRVLSYNCVI